MQGSLVYLNSSMLISNLDRSVKCDTCPLFPNTAVKQLIKAKILIKITAITTLLFTNILYYIMKQASLVLYYSQRETSTSHLLAQVYVVHKNIHLTFTNLTLKVGNPRICHVCKSVWVALCLRTKLFCNFIITFSTLCHPCCRGCSQSFDELLFGLLPSLTFYPLFKIGSELLGLASLLQHPSISAY